MYKEDGKIEDSRKLEDPCHQRKEVISYFNVPDSNAGFFISFKSLGKNLVNVHREHLKP